MSSQTSCVEIDLDVLKHNLDQWQRVVGADCEVCPVVKADAYGLGAPPLARRLSRGKGGVSIAAVYDAAQASRLIEEADVSCDVLILMPVERIEPHTLLHRALARERVHLSIHSPEQLRAVNEMGRRCGARIPVHSQVDTGISRGGMPPEQAHRLLTQIRRYRFIRLTGVFTHPASPLEDVPFTELQLQRFDDLLRRCDGLIPEHAAVHFGGTYAALRDRRYHKSMVRIGLGLYGYGLHKMAEEPMLTPPPALRPVMRWISRIVHINQVPAGTPVGYDGLFVTGRDSRLAIVPVGYADGYPLALSNRSTVRLGPSRTAAPVRGKINMDQIIVDVTHMPEADIGAEVELISDDPHAPNALPRLAELSGSSCYEMLCRLSPRLPRRYARREQAAERDDQPERARQPAPLAVGGAR